MSERQLVHTTETGVKLYSRGPADGQVYNEVFRENVYLPAVQALTELPYDRPRVIVDLGANVGFFTLYCVNCLRHAKQSHHIYAVEAYPPSAEEFVWRVQSHDNLFGTRVNIANGLAGLREGSEVIAVPQVLFEGEPVDHHCCVSTVPCVQHMATHHNISVGYEYRAEIMVPYVNLDTFVPAGPVDLLKIDIEGSEELVLKTYPELLRRTKILAIEFHPATCDVAQCKEYLAEYGFARTPVDKDQALEFYVR